MRSSTIIAACLVMLLCAATSFAAVFEVGPGKPYTNIRDVPWENIAAGDTVNIYYRATPYNDKFDVTVEGTATQPVVIHGVRTPAESCRCSTATAPLNARSSRTRRTTEASSTSATGRTIRRAS